MVDLQKWFLHRDPIEIVLPGLRPVSKPRMTQKDKWAKRPSVMAYRAYCDELRERLHEATGGPIECSGGFSWLVWFKMPDHWSRKKREEMRDEIHQVRPDRDNIDKGILDALFAEDASIAFGSINKKWDDGNGPRMEFLIE